jgi:hypothetical protein
LCTAVNVDAVLQASDDSLVHLHQVTNRFAHPTVFDEAGCYIRFAHPAVFDEAGCYTRFAHPAVFDEAGCYIRFAHPTVFDEAGCYIEFPGSNLNANFVHDAPSRNQSLVQSRPVTNNCFDVRFLHGSIHQVTQYYLQWRTVLSDSGAVFSVRRRT